MEETIYPEKWVKPEIEELGNAKDLVAAVNNLVAVITYSVYYYRHKISWKSL